MRKNRLGYQKKALLSMSAKDAVSHLQHLASLGQCSAALARWVYRHADRWEDSDYVEKSSMSLFSLQSDEWVFDFLWSELLRRKCEPFGDSILVAIGAQISPDPNGEIEALVGLYHDEDASFATRGSTLFVLNDRICLYEIEEEMLANARAVCKDALWNESNPYARGGASWLAKNYSGFEERVRELQKDDALTITGRTVSYYAEMVDLPS